MCELQTVNIDITKFRFTIIGVDGPNEDKPVANIFRFYETVQGTVTAVGNS